MSNYRDAVLADGPLGYWPLDEIGGAVAVDRSPNKRDGVITLANVVQGQPGLVGDPGSATNTLGNPSVTVPFIAALHPGPVFTAEFWMASYVAGTVGGGFFDNTDAQGDFLIYGAGANPGHVYCRANVALATEIDYSAIPYNDGTGIFHHWVWTRSGDAGTSILYRDGVAVVTTPSVIAITPATSGSTNLGFRGAGAGSGQRQCHHALYGYPLSAQRVLDHYRLGVVASGEPFALQARGGVIALRGITGKPL